MGQIIFSRNPIGSVGLGLFLLGISVFVYSIFDPLFGPLAIACIATGAVVAAFLLRRRPKTPHVDPRQPDASHDTSRPIEPR
jgi:membrane-bound ClpP family serine protease